MPGIEMDNRPVNPIEQAEEEVPRMWFEMDHRVFLAASIAFVISFNTLYNMYAYDQEWAHLLSSGLFVASAIFNRYATLKAFQAQAQLQEAGLEPEVQEANYLLLDINTPEQFQQ